MRLRVIDNQRVAEDHFEMTLPLSDSFRPVRPGQFVGILCRDMDALDPLLRRPFSVYAVGGDAFKVMYRVQGRGTRILSGVGRGETVDVIGPLGRGFEWERFGAAHGQGGRVMLIGGGVGVPPMYFLSQRLRDAGIPFDVLVGFAAAKWVVAVDAWRKWGVEPHVATDDGSVGHQGYVTQLLEAELERGQPKILGVFACGPRPMLAAVAALCARHDVPCQVAMEEWMGCGIGVCLSCVCEVHEMGGKAWARVCREGPVFDARKVVWHR